MAKLVVSTIPCNRLFWSAIMLMLKLDRAILHLLLYIGVGDGCFFFTVVLSCWFKYKSIFLLHCYSAWLNTHKTPRSSMTLVLCITVFKWGWAFSFVDCINHFCFFILQSAIFNFQSLLTVILLLICTCAYIRAMAPSLLDKNKTG